MKGPAWGERALSVTTVDAHTAGEPLRIVTAGLPEIPGETMLEKRRFAREHLEELRRLLIFEPRGHADMYACFLTDPVTADGDTGVLFVHNEGYSTMCGHAVIALATVGVDAGWFEGPTVRFDTPAGRVEATAQMSSNGVESISFLNVPSFVFAKDFEVEVPGLGLVRSDVAYGGAFYAYVDAVDVGVDVAPESFREIVDVAMRIKHAVANGLDLEHPDGEPDLNFLYGTVLVAPPSPASGAGVHSRNVCVFADGEVDRSPTGTGVSGRAAIHHARGDLALGESLTIESLIGTRFEVEAARETQVGDRPAIVPRVTGSAYVTGRHEFRLDPRDPLARGFFLR